MTAVTAQSAPLLPVKGCLVEPWLGGAARELRAYIPFMIPDERKIIAWLIAHNQKTFTAAVDGGHAATLLSRGIVVTMGRAGQRIDLEDVPMGIPDHLWEVLVQHKQEFPYTNVMAGLNRIHGESHG
jgi:hypothetical protein